MNRHLTRLLVATAILSLAATVQAAMVSGRSQFMSPNGFRHGDFDHDRFFDHHHFFHHDRTFFFFDFGFPVFYYPSCYYYPPAYYNSASYYYPSYSYSSPTYRQLGHDWAQDLRLGIVTWDQFVSYVKAYIANAPTAPRDDFRRGFIAAYGENGDAAFAKALKDTETPAVSQSPSQSSDSGRSRY